MLGVESVEVKAIVMNLIAFSAMCVSDLWSGGCSQ